jgi:hypothetical protein
MINLIAVNTVVARSWFGECHPGRAADHHADGDQAPRARIANP